jgi:hypothetical protein
MIEQLEHVRVITNDAEGNKPGDFALVRVELQLISDRATYVAVEGWELLGFSYTARTREPEDYVDLVYRFGGEAQRPGGAP